jgi:hypothetical protein
MITKNRFELQISLSPINREANYFDVGKADSIPNISIIWLNANGYRRLNLIVKLFLLCERFHSNHSFYSCFK